MVRRGRKKEIPKITKDQLLIGIVAYLADQDEKFVDKLIRWVKVEEELQERREKYEALRRLKNPTRGQKVAMAKLAKQINALENLLRLVRGAIEES